VKIWNDVGKARTGSVYARWLEETKARGTTEQQKAKKSAKKHRKAARKLAKAAIPASLAKVRAQGVKPLGKPAEGWVKDDGFYATRAWRELRYLALVNNGGICQCCGARASDGVRIHVDHIKPRYKFPKLALELTNLQILCDDCNYGKGAWDSTDWR
jgi:5-methylcytosine-specific restriction endonuclease McrA